MKFLGIIFWSFYELFWLLIHFICLFRGFFPRSFQRQLKSRKIIFNKPLNFKSGCDVLILCSSAGEFEQILPVLKLLKSNGYSFKICFFSVSGLKYSQRKNLYYSDSFLAPLESCLIWKNIYAQLNPKLVILVRHDIWPASMLMAPCSRWLVNASFAHLKAKSWQVPIRVQLLKFFNKVYFIHEEERTFLSRWCKNKSDFMVAADTKFDRVVQLVDEVKTSEYENDILSLARGRKIIVLGSAWPPEMQLLASLPEEYFEKYFWVVVPHNISKTIKKTAVDILYHHHIQAVDELDTQKPTDILYLNKIGQLQSIYRLGHAAFIGGALEHKVHNVIEAAVLGCAVASGPRIHSQRDAQMLHVAGFLKIIHSADELKRWIDSIFASDELEKLSQKQFSFLKSLSGGSEYLYSQMQAVLKG